MPYLVIACTLFHYTFVALAQLFEVPLVKDAQYSVTFGQDNCCLFQFFLYNASSVLTN